MSTRRDVFHAIADPTRREIINLLSEEPMNLNALADQFDISRPAVSQQVKIPEECGLVDISQIGRERYCRIQPASLVLPLCGLSSIVSYGKIVSTLSKNT